MTPPVKESCLWPSAPSPRPSTPASPWICLSTSSRRSLRTPEALPGQRLHRHQEAPSISGTCSDTHPPLEQVQAALLQVTPMTWYRGLRSPAWCPPRSRASFFRDFGFIYQKLLFPSGTIWAELF